MTTIICPKTGRQCELTACNGCWDKPVLKTLTDEEIYEVWWQSDVASNYYRDSKEFGIEFARAILRKAQLTCNGFCGEYECKENKTNCLRKAQEK